MPLNQAAWLVTPKSPQLEIKQAPYPTAGPKDVVVKVEAVAINPLEYMIQDTNPAIGGKQIEYPTILGADAAGYIVAAGAEVKTRKIQDRVITNVSGLGPRSAAFQHFLVVAEDHTIKLPDGVGAQQAVVLPLACDTASAGLFVPDRLGLSTAGLSQPGAPTIGQTIVIWGGSSSVGCCATQLAKAAGYKVYTTASRRNHELCLSIGADQVFDYNDPNIEAQLVQALQGEISAGALDCVSNDKTIPACVRVLAMCAGTKKVVTVLTPGDTIDRSVEVQRLSIPSLMGTDTYRIVHAFLEAGLADGRLQAKPDAKVVGHGLAAIQQGIDAVRQGQSATKIVVRL